MGFCPYRACCYGLLAHFMACCLYGLLPFHGVAAMGFLPISWRAAYMGFCPFMALLLWLLITQYTSCTVEIIQHALKGQKLLAQGIALGFCFVRKQLAL